MDLFQLWNSILYFPGKRDLLLCDISAFQMLYWTFQNGVWLRINLTFNNNFKAGTIHKTYNLPIPLLKFKGGNPRIHFSHNICRLRAPSSHTPILLTLVHPSISSFLSGHPQAVAAEASKDWGGSVGHFADLLRWSAENVDLSSHRQRPVRAPMHFP